MFAARTLQPSGSHERMAAPGGGTSSRMRRPSGEAEQSECSDSIMARAARRISWSRSTNAVAPAGPHAHVLSERRAANGFGASPSRSAGRRGSLPRQESFKGPLDKWWGLKSNAKEFTKSPPGSRSSLFKHESVTKGMQKTGFVIDPRNARFMPTWDLTMVGALAFTAIVTPFEVIYMDEGSYITPMWYINRVIDLMFLLDMILIFHLAYQETLEAGGHWVYNKRLIGLKYLKGWFIIDLLSVLPFWALTLDVDDPFGKNRAAGSDPQINSLQLTRAFKLARMLKLARVLKASRVLKRALMDIVMGQLELTFAVLKMLKLISVLVLWSHWQACLWGLFSSYLDGDTWISAFDEHFEQTNGRRAEPFDRYAAALYWSIMTLTSIGYGEMLPENTTERMLACTYMLISGCIWTYVIGSVASIATTLDPNSVAYHNTMDQLNYFMRERGLPRPMRYALRDYFTNARNVHQITSDADLLSKMSPLLQGTVALAANRRWLGQVWYFKRLGDSREGREFIASLAKQLVIRAYVSHERLPVGYLYILKRGLVVKLWRFLGSGKVWGEDIILDMPELIDHSQAVALTYVETYTLRRNELDGCTEDYPVAHTVVAKARRKITMQRAILKYLCEVVCGRQVRSFATRSAARGFSEVADTMTLEQKVDLLVSLNLKATNSSSFRKKHGGAGLPTPVAAVAGGNFDAKPSVLDAPPSVLVDGPPVVGHMPSSDSRVSSFGESPSDLAQLSVALADMDKRHAASLAQLSTSQQTMASQLSALADAVAAISEPNRVVAVAP